MNLINGLHFRIIDTEHHLYPGVKNLRFEYLRKPLGLELTDADTRNDRNEIILVAVFAGKVIASVQLRPLENGKAKLRQMVVDAPYRKKGVGRLLLQYAEKVALTRGFNIMELNARKYAVPFYEKCGYLITTHEFIEVGIPHYKMEKRLCNERT